MRARRGGAVPAVAITLGDPAGIGPEVALRAVRDLTDARTSVVLIGDVATAEETAARLRLGLRIDPVESAADLQATGTRAGKRGLPILPARLDGTVVPLGARDRRPGHPSVAGARVAYASIATAVDLVQAGGAGSICTAPISKEWLARARIARTGHTEILAELTHASGVRMMMATPNLRVVLATTHVALRELPDALTVAGVRETIAIAAATLRRWWRIKRPRIAVAALNPHAGDGGIYGDEEARILSPAIRGAQRSGIAATGPWPADTLFSELGPPADAIIALYHDQGLIPVKQNDVHRAVNVTLGLPFVRTSPDHGTAYAIAGKNRADPRSMGSALALALELASGGAAKERSTRMSQMERAPRRPVRR